MRVGIEADAHVEAITDVVGGESPVSTFVKLAKHRGMHVAAAAFSNVEAGPVAAIKQPTEFGLTQKACRSDREWYASGPISG